MNDAVISADSLGQIIFWNRSAERIFGYREEEAIGQPLTVLFPPHSQWAGNGDLQSLITGESPLVGNLMEMQARRKDGSDFPLELSLASWQTHGGRFISAVLRDITRRKQAENALEESRHFIQRVAEMMPNILYVYDVKKECNIFINRGLESILGHAWEEGAGLSMPAITEEIHAEDLARVAWANEQCQSAKDGAVIEVEYRVRHADGSWRWLHCRNTIFVRNLDGNPEQILGTAEDITERKRLEQEVLEIAASEQRRIGQELHDGTGQELTGLAMLAANLADSLTNTRPEDAQLSRRIAQGVSHALTHVRALSRGLIPVEVDAEGLMSALSDLTQRIADLHRLQCDFECVEPVPIEDNHTATQLYRIAQEAITNALKHGQPTRIRVSLEMRGHYVTLRIADDGVGIPTDELKVGTGLRIMRYRAGQIGAHLSVRPGPVRGTVVACTLFCGDQS
jgi:PAS domain S-box-containing protein